MKTQKNEIKKEKVIRNKNQPSTKRKGKIHSEATTFNHPRKDIHSPT